MKFYENNQNRCAMMARVTTAGRIVAAYVWDYAEGMALIRRFWEAAVELDPSKKELDEGADSRSVVLNRLRSYSTEPACRMSRPAPTVPTIFTDRND
jgi:hypothetical protein